MKCASGHGHPGKIICRHGDKQDKEGFFSIGRILPHSAENRFHRNTDGHNGGDPPDSRAAEGRNVGDAVSRGAGIKPNRLGSEGPFVPGRLAKVGGSQLAVVAVHGLLLLDNDVQHLSETQ